MTLARPILIVEDDAELAATLAEQVAMDGEFSAETAASAAEAVARLADADTRFDAVILDIGLPDGDGRELCAALRRDGKRMPIIMLTGRDAEGDVVRGLESGANDYVAKPFRLSELLARLRAQLRVFDNSEDATFAIGQYQFRPSARLLLDPAKNRKVRLTDKECRILKFLLRANSAPVNRATLLAEVWGFNSGVTTHTLETHVYRLRQKMESDPANPKLLLTDRGAYRLEPRMPERLAA
ncbi:response regulator transcription factor [Paracraurococcus ruber]|uniref:DNA-binding response regulator n=1 Tax=Paracraurococcus ruber TaxID=77675 RepID=A0ABS1CS49_9PROT|nr:response regulator transcription factor [Paracraurococcus ruber]MBK1656822.1 DNA-binding response regulator [Paracraurococcus ruber]TDG33936.1 response regulator transcription factor [Paracraurococcus ruber]